MRYLILFLILILPAVSWAIDNPLNTGPIRGGNLGEANPYTLGIKPIVAASTGGNILLETNDALLLETDDNYLME